MRGLLHVHRPLRRHVRYNPACAGTTNDSAGWNGTVQIQPRVCGDYFPVSAGYHPFLDTTPRVRGLLHDAVQAVKFLRYNPACAGTTQNLLLVSQHQSIQPRVCGDYYCVLSFDHSPIDTTPRVRGLHFAVPLYFKGSRYNPACAGTTYRQEWQGLPDAIQPRVCGDYTKESLALEPFYHN